MTVWDDGTGPALYVGGELSLAGDVPVRNLAEWDGAAWHDVGGGTGGTVRALVVWDDGTGPALFVGGEFQSVGKGEGQAIKALAKWDGNRWSAVGEITDVAPKVHALAVWNDGTGPALYAGGVFEIDGTGSPCIAKWDGKKWSGLGTGMVGWQFDGQYYPLTVDALAVYDDGEGPKLYAGGSFWKAGDVLAADIACWDGQRWWALPNNGVWGGGYLVRALLPWDDGSGPSLFIGGHFEYAGGKEIYGIVRYDGAWHDLGTGANVFALRPFNDGGGAALYMASYGGLARWDGREWTQVGPGMKPDAYALEVFDPPGAAGPGLYIGGPQFAGELGVHGIARWDGQAYSVLGQGNGIEGTVSAAIEWDDGSGPALYIGGSLVSAGTLPIGGVARWDGMRWADVSAGLPSGEYDDVGVTDFAIFDDGLGPKLYAAGGFYSHEAKRFKNVVRWDGARWTYLDGGEDDAAAMDLAVWDDGSGPALYVCGQFKKIGGVPAKWIARWDGRTWSGLPSNFEGHHVGVLGVYDDGMGSALYVGGDLSKAGGVPVNGIVRWDGQRWSDVGGGMRFGKWPGVVRKLAVYRSRDGSCLYAAGDFDLAGDTAVRRIARWDGTKWSDVAGGISRGGSPRALAVFNDLSGECLFATGIFDEAGGITARGIARFDGVRWSALGKGLGGWLQSPHALAPAMFVPKGALFPGGGFTNAGGRGSAGIACWCCVADWHAGDSNCDGVVTFDDVDPFVVALSDKNEYERQFPGCLWLNADCNADNEVNFADINPFLVLLTR